MDSKYIIFQSPSKGFPEALIFPETIGHDEMANLVGRDRVISAGKVIVMVEDNYDTKIVPYGRSDSLHLSYRPDDEQILEKALGIERY